MRHAFKLFPLALVAALCLVATKFAHAQTISKVDALTYCESCGVGGFDLQFDGLHVSAAGLVDRGDGVFVGTANASGLFTDPAASVACTFIDNPHQAGSKWIGSLLITGKGFALASTAVGDEPFPGPVVMEQIKADVAVGAPGKVKNWLKATSIGALKDATR